MKVRVQNPTTVTQYVDARVTRNGQLVDTRIPIVPRSIQWLHADLFLGLDQHGTSFANQPQLKILAIEGLTPTATQQAAQKVAEAQNKPLASAVEPSTDREAPTQRTDQQASKASKQ